MKTAKGEGQVSTFNDDAERDRSKRFFRQALKWSFPLTLAFVFLRDVPATGARSFLLFLVFLCAMFLFCGALYWGARAIWFGASLLILTAPPAWRNAVQVALVLAIWSGPLFYFARTSSTLTSIVGRTSGWTLVAATVVGVLACGLAIANGIAHIPARAFVVATAVVAVLCFMTKQEISFGDSYEDAYFESMQVSLTSPDERAYLHYLLYSAFAFGGILVASRRRLI